MLSQNGIMMFHFGQLHILNIAECRPKNVDTEESSVDDSYCDRKH